MKGTLLCCLLLVCFRCGELLAQDHPLSGVVCDRETQEKLPGANVLLYADSGKMLKFTTTDKEGTFRIVIPAEAVGASYLQVSYMGYETLRRRTDRTDDWKLKLLPKATVIKEVIVKAPKIKAQGDTLVYDVRQFSKEGDRSIGDVLRRMPGIKTGENGQISYNGKPINRFYIENSDLLEGRYGIATHNISSAEVGSVEILQNHQPVKALEGLAFSEQAAINLRLKEGAKHKWIGTLKVYGGMTPDEGQWNAQGTFMRFTRKSQSLNTLKSNNTGQDISRELNSFNVHEMRNRANLLPDYVELTPPYSMGLNRDRELMNTTHQLTSHNLFKLKNGGDVKVGLTYQHHQEEAYKETESVYLSEGEKDGWTILETEESDFRQNALVATVSTELNQPTYNLSERFAVSLDWRERDIALGGQQSNTQDLYGGSKKLVNDLYLLKRSGNHFYNLSSYTVLHAAPQRLRVQKDGTDLTQKVHPFQVFSNNTLGWGVGWGKVTVDFSANLSGLYRDLDSDLSGWVGEEFPVQNDLVFGFIKTGLSPRVTYQSGRFRSVLTLPLTYYLYRYKDKVQDGTETEHRVQWTPSLYAELQLTSRWRLFVRGSWGEQPVNVQNFYSSPLLRNYRNLTQGLPEFCYPWSAAVSGGVEYNLPLNGFYSGVSWNRSWNESPYTLSQSLSDDYIVSKYVRASRQTETQGLSVHVSKETAWAATTFSLQGGWSRNESYLLRNGDKVESRQDIFRLEPEVDMNPVTWLNFRYVLAYRHVTLSADGLKEKTSTLKHSLSARFLLSSRFNFTLRGEHYANRMSEGQMRDFYLADLLATYKFSNRFSLDLQLTNLFNEREYAYTSYSDEAVRVSRRYTIRPRTLLVGAFVTF